MDDKLDSTKVSPPQSIIIQAAYTDNVSNTSNAATFPRAQRKHNKSGFKKANQVIDKSKKKKKVIDKRKNHKQMIDKRKNLKQGIISVDEGPSGELLGSSLLMIIISTIAVFTDIEGDLLWCLMCNGNAIGFILLGVYSAQYGKWKKSSEANASAIFPNLIGAMAFIVAVIFVILWLIFLA
jgi:hypothetical protein